MREEQMTDTESIQMMQIKLLLVRTGFVSDGERCFDTYTPTLNINGRRYEVTTHPPANAPSIGNHYAWVEESNFDGRGVVGEDEESARELAMQMVDLIPAMIKTPKGTA